MSKNRIPLLAGVALSAFTASSAALAQDHSFCLEDTFTNAGDGDDRVINLAISLYGQAPAGSDDRARYESVFRSFARGVYEATNGAHYIGELTIYQNGAQKRFADIIWGRGTTDAEWRENLTYLNATSFRGGIAHDFAKIWMYDHSQDNRDPDPNNAVLIDMVRAADPVYQEVQGFIVAHEFAHFAYSFFDEYVRTDDYPEVHTLMGNSSKATWDRGTAAYDYPYLNFSTEVTPDWDETSNQQKTYWGDTGWGFMAKSCENRPPYSEDSSRSNIFSDDGEASPFQHQMRHVFYQGLANAQPLTTDTWTHPTTGITYPKMKVDLDTAGEEPVKYLNFTWSDARVEMELVLDTSGSMDGQPLANVKFAASEFVDDVVPDRTHLGLTTFEATVNNRFPLTAMNLPNAQQQLRDTIDLITVGTDTAMYAGVKAGLQKLAELRAMTGSSARQVMFLLSDGNDNASGGVSEGEVVGMAREAGVRINTVGYADRDGSEAYWGTLQNIAYNTGGQFFYGLTNPADISNAMRIAFGDALDLQDVELYGEGCLGELFNVDPACRAIVGFAYSVMSFEIEYMPGTDGDPNYVVAAPDGTVVPSETLIRERMDGSRAMSVIVDADTLQAYGTGEWELRRTFVNNNAVFGQRHVLATPADDTAPVELVVSSRRRNYVYPQPIQIDASVVLDTPIAGLELIAEFVASSGTVGEIQLVDDGTGSDDVPDDGVYGGLFGDYDVNGTYDVKVTARSNGQAMRVYQAHEFGGEPNLVPLDAEFALRQQIKIGVSGVVADDHANSTTGATVIAPDYRSHAGKIEQSGDIDFFRVDDIDTSDSLAVRLYEPDFGLAPEVTIYDASGQALVTGTGLNSLSLGGYISLQVPLDQLQPTMYFSVRDLNGNPGGTYAVDAGPVVSVDQAAPPLVEVRSRDTRGAEGNVSGIEFELQNNSSRDISNFKVVYYFETEYFQTPVLENEWSELAEVSLIERGSEQYAVEFDYTGFTLSAGELLPSEPETSVGLHYSDWTPWDRANDYSNILDGDFIANPQMAIFNEYGHLIYGSVPPVRAARTPVVDVTVLSREEKLNDPAWTGPDFYIRNNGDPISNFKVYYYFQTEQGKQPILADWDTINSSASLQSLGGGAWRIIANYSGFTHKHSFDNNAWPSRTLVGVHYPDWSFVNKTNDSSNNRSPTYLVNSRIEVRDSAGNLIYGSR